MRNRKHIIQEVYAELKEVLGDEFTSRELLETAADIVRSTIGTGQLPRCDLRTGRLSFEERPLYDAFSDGGIKIWCMEAIREEKDFGKQEIDQWLDQVFDQAA